MLPRCVTGGVFTTQKGENSAEEEFSAKTRLTHCKVGEKRSSGLCLRTGEISPKNHSARQKSSGSLASSREVFTGIQSISKLQTWESRQGSQSSVRRSIWSTVIFVWQSGAWQRPIQW